jgi:hypothetical protein
MCCVESVGYLNWDNCLLLEILLSVSSKDYARPIAIGFVVQD